MPIRPHHRAPYPFDWPQLSQAVRFRRAKGRSEQCARPHGHQVRHLGDARWWDEAGAVWRSGSGCALPPLMAPDASIRTTHVVLACAHLDDDPTNNEPDNLQALRQRRHMLHDREEHLRRRWMTYRMRRAMGDPFLGSYQTA